MGGLTAFDGKEHAALFAHCAPSAVNALYEPASRYNDGRVSASGKGSITPTSSLAPSGHEWHSISFRRRLHLARGQERLQQHFVAPRVTRTEEGVHRGWRFASCTPSVVLHQLCLRIIGLSHRTNANRQVWSK
jgi:hypothetical protein